MIYLRRQPGTADAVLVFDRLEPANVSYSIRMNHTSVPSGRLLLDYFSPAPDPEYQMYWFFANVQQLVRVQTQGWNKALLCSCFARAVLSAVSSGWIPLNL